VIFALSQISTARPGRSAKFDLFFQVNICRSANLDFYCKVKICRSANLDLWRQFSSQKCGNFDHHHCKHRRISTASVRRCSATHPNFDLFVAGQNFIPTKHITLQACGGAGALQLCWHRGFCYLL
jgi:hypothetical protein